MQRIASLVFVLLTIFTSFARATGLRVPIDNGLGVPGVASGPALAEDASTGFTNPAGLLRINHPELVVAVNPAFTSNEFEGTVRVNPPEVLLPNGDSLTIDTTYTGEADAKLNVPLIAIHFSYPISEWLVYGFSLTNPFGQSVNFGDSSIVGSTVTEAMLITWNIANSFGIRVTDQFSVGVGIDAIRLDFAADNIYPFTITPPDPFPQDPITLPSIFTHNSASGWTVSWHAGLLYQFNNYHSRVGFNYRPQVTMTGEGKSYSIANESGEPNFGPKQNRDFEIEFDLPPIYSLAIYHEIMPRLDIAGSVEYTQWDVFDSISFENIVNAGDFDAEQGYTNTWGFGAALFYQWTRQFRTSAGVKFDFSPVHEDFVNVDFPDSDVWVLGVSCAYQFNKVVRLEVGYAHSFFEEVDINHFDPVGYVTNTGHGHLYGDIINTQLTMNLAPVVKAFDDFNEKF